MGKHNLRDALSRNLAALMEKTPALDTQIKVANRSGVAQSTIGRILRRETAATLDNIEAIAKAFGVESRVLLSHSNDSSAHPGIILDDLNQDEFELVKQYVDFLRYQRIGGGHSLSVMGTTAPDTQHAQILRANMRPIRNDTFQEDRTETPGELQRPSETAKRRR